MFVDGTAEKECVCFKWKRTRYHKLLLMQPALCNRAYVLLCVFLCVKQQQHLLQYQPVTGSCSTVTERPSVYISLSLSLSALRMCALYKQLRGNNYSTAEHPEHSSSANARKHWQTQKHPGKTARPLNFAFWGKISDLLLMFTEEVEWLVLHEAVFKLHVTEWDRLEVHSVFICAAVIFLIT